MSDAQKSAPKKKVAVKKLGVLARLGRPKKENKPVEVQALIKTLQMVGLDDFMSLLGNPKKLLLWNFVLGMVRGLGVVIGMTVVVAVLVWVLTLFVDFPLIGDYFKELLDLLKSQSPGGVPVIR